MFLSYEVYLMLRQWLYACCHDKSTANNSGNRMMNNTDQAIGGHKRLDYLSWSFCEEISFIYFGELKRDKFHRLFWSVIIISSHSFLFLYRRLQVELYLVFLKRTSFFSSALNITCTSLHQDLNKLWNVYFKVWSLFPIILLYFLVESYRWNCKKYGIIAKEK